MVVVNEAFEPKQKLDVLLKLLTLVKVSGGGAPTLKQNTTVLDTVPELAVPLPVSV
jgi:hypothetical protein